MSVGRDIRVRVRVRDGNFVIVAADTILADCVVQKVHTGGFDPRFVQRELQLVWAHSCEESNEGPNMVDGRIVRFDCITEVHSNVVDANRVEARGGDKLGKSAGGVLGHAETFVESVGGAKCSYGGSIRVDYLNV